jgi:2-keto-4-pentenoate hydratase
MEPSPVRMIDLERICLSLIDAEDRRRPLPPLTETEPGFDVTAAYRVQSLVWERRLAAGHRPVGHKVGLTNPAMQRQLGVEEPDYGRLHEGMEVRDTFDLDELIQARIEPEICFVLSSDLAGPGVTADAVLEATLAIAPALEVIDSRIEAWRIKLPDTVADNASSARFVVGPRQPLDGLDLAAVEATLLMDGEPVGSGRGEAVLGHPAAAVAWLANTLAKYGEHLSATEIVLPGAMCASVPLRAGSTFVGQFDGLGEVGISVGGAAT